MNLDVAIATVLIFAAACYALLGLRLVVLKREVGTVPIGILFIVIAFWVVGGGIELMSTTFVGFSIGRTGHFVGTALVPVVAYVCFREYTGAETSAIRLALLSFIPLVSIGLAATNAHHEFMWYAPFVNASGEFLTHPAKWGPWFLFVHLPYSYIVIGVAIFGAAALVYFFLFSRHHLVANAPEEEVALMQRAQGELRRG